MVFVEKPCEHLRDPELWNPQVFRFEGNRMDQRFQYCSDDRAQYSICVDFVGPLERNVEACESSNLIGSDGVGDAR